MSPSSDHDVREQGQESGPLDGKREFALALGRDGGYAGRHDLAALREETRQKPNVLVVDLRRVRPGERAGLPPAIKRSAGADCGTTGSRVDLGDIRHGCLFLRADAQIFAEFLAGAE